MGILADYLKTVPLEKLLGPQFAQFEADHERLKSDLQATRDQLQAAQAEVDRLKPYEAQTMDLLRQNRELQVKLLDAENAVLTLKSLPPKKISFENDLSETQERILSYLTTVEGSAVEPIALNIRSNIDKTRALLVELQKARLVWLKGFHDRESEWRIGQEGRNYLTARHLAA